MSEKCRVWVLVALLVGALIGVGISYVGLTMLQPRAKEVQVGVFYYVWYNPTDPVSWEYPKIIDTPVLGHYNSCDPSVIRQHLAYMNDLQIDFAIISWWGFYNQTAWHAFVHNATVQVFQAAADSLSQVKLAILVEPFINSTQFPGWTYNHSEIYDYVYAAFVQRYPTVYYTYEERPLVCFYADANLTLDGDLPKDDRMMVKIVGDAPYADWIYTDLVKEWDSEPVMRNRQVSVTPRFDDSRFRNSPVVDIDLADGVYDAEWQRALDLARTSAVDVVTICSWNEYPERTAIEPHDDATAYDPHPYFLYDKTKQYISQLKGSPP